MNRPPQFRTRFLVPEIPAPGQTIELSEHARGVAAVLRLKSGETVVLLDGRGSWGKASLLEVGSKRLLASVESKTCATPADRSIRLIQGIPKLDKAEWIIQKTTELGVHRLTFVGSERSIPVKKPRILERWKKIAEEACRQSGCLYLPEIQLSSSLEEAFEGEAEAGFCVLCDEHEVGNNILSVLEKWPPTASLTLAVGPEGGWTPSEAQKFREKRYVSVSLGENTLRTETAATVAVAIASVFMLK